MAQTKKKKRSTKHRGNAAGMIETRGRTGRKPTVAEIKAQSRADRLNKPPTWRAAINKAAIAAVVFAIAIIILFKKPIAQGAGLALFTFVIYIPLSFYTDKIIYDRAQRKKAAT